MRVAVNAEQLLYRSPGGIGRYTAQLLTVLPELFPGDEVVPFTARHPAAEIDEALRRAGASERTVASAIRSRVPRPLLYESWARIARPHLPDLRGAELFHAPSVAVPPHPDVPLVATVHDAAPVLFPEAFPARGRRIHHQALATVASRADLVLTVSQAAADEIAAHTSIPAERIRVVHNGVRPPNTIDAPQRGRPYVLWVGSLEPRKGVGTLVAAMARLGRPDVDLVLAGYAAWPNDTVVDPADRAALGETIRRLGPLTEDALWSLYAGATLFAFPSRHEGFGMPVLEAMSQGVPVVASDIAAIREIAGGAAVLVPPGDVDAWAQAIGGLLGDDGERRRLAEAGRDRSRVFSLEATIRGIRAVYEEAGAGPDAR